MKAKTKNRQPDLTLEINGHIWNIYVLSKGQLEDLLDAKPGFVPLGACHYAVHRIYLRDDIPPAQAITTLGHELIHASFEPALGAVEASSSAINQEIACDLAAGVVKAITKSHKEVQSFIKKHFKETPFEIEDDGDVLWLGKA